MVKFKNDKFKEKETKKKTPNAVKQMTTEERTDRNAHKETVLEYIVKARVDSVLSKMTTSEQNNKGFVLKAVVTDAWDDIEKETSVEVLTAMEKTGRKYLTGQMFKKASPLVN